MKAITKVPLTLRDMEPVLSFGECGGREKGIP